MKIIRTTLFLLLLWVSLSDSLTAQVKSPADFLGYEIGERWTPHHLVMDYMRHVADESDQVTLEQYGTTNENRELVYLVITSPENHENIDEIRTNNLKFTGLLDGEPTENQKGIVWLSYNIHGNETSSSEAAMLTIYELVGSGRADTEVWLENTVVIMDPMVNPDGRERYVNWYRQMKGAEVNPALEAREHHEPWPGGRPNHYLFDLNRDWAWQTQIESRQRYSVYKQWFPHIHVDYHEQGFNAPYYFAPAAAPYHNVITDWQKQFQTTIGENHVGYFDDAFWLYFTKERFDLFYPSYGDTWPTFHGAIGMTYEMPGHSLSGLAVERAVGDTLTLKQRALQHFTTGISTVETASVNSEQMVNEFKNYFNKARNNPDGTYKTFVVKADNHPDNVYDLLSDLDSKEIEYGRAGSSQTEIGYDYSTGERSRVSVEPEDILISARQPQGNLVRVLFEPDPELADSLTYDITAWEAHYRFGLNGYALENRIEPSEPVTADEFQSPGITGAEKPFAYISKWNSMHDARFLAEITKRGVKARVSEIPFVIDGREYAAGSLIITRKDNHLMMAQFDEIVRDAAEMYNRALYGSTTGFVESGSDFGSSNIRFIGEPKLAVLMGEGTSSLNAGEIWHYFDQQLGYPATLIHASDVNRTDFADYDVMVIPSGSYSGVLNDSAIEKISEWTRDGGTLITFGRTNRLLAGRDGFQLQRKVAESGEENPSIEEQLQPYQGRDRRAATSRTPGSIFRVDVDNTHPLGFGYPDEYFSLKTDASAFSYLNSGWNVGSVQEDAHRSGFAGVEAKANLEHTLSFGVQRHGSGQVVYFIDNPLFRGFWENGKLFVANAVFFVGR
ncbi:MAG TPA: M14 family metallopeptidase [Balneolaceae bacterium]|nr:M14 family metallopeptidase [Balneolaceae bacterium]